MTGRYLIKEGELQPSVLPLTRRTESGILLLDCNDQANPWAIGVGGDAQNPKPISELPVADCQMSFDSSAGSATILMQEFAGSRLIFTYYPSLSGVGGVAIKGPGFEITALLEGMSITGGGDVARMRLYQGVFSLLGADGSEYVVVSILDALQEQYKSFLDVMQPVGFGASAGEADHTAGGELIVDVYYDGIPDDAGTAGFWTGFLGCREVA